MKILTFIFFLIIKEAYNWKFFHNGRRVGGNLGSPKGEDLIQYPASHFERWFTQNLDHFDLNNEQTWQQRYYVNEQFFNERQRNVVFLMIGGEGEATDKWMTKGAWIEYAQRCRALCFQVEHRYYGKSHPTANLSIENLPYLNSRQALADLATFIEAMNLQYHLSLNVKWIAFGGSYPGSLAAWMRMKYPHLVHGAMSASGPLLAEVDFMGYFWVVYDDLKNISPACVQTVLEGTRQIDRSMSDIVGQQNLNKLFKLCDPFEKSVDNELDVSNLFATLAGNFAGIAQYNKDNREDAHNRTSNITLDTLCDIMVNGTGDQITRLAAVNDLILNSTNQTCLDYKYDKMIAAMKDVAWTSEVSEGGRQWMYQTCTEFGFFQTSKFKPEIFSNKFPVEFFVRQCGDIFGPNYNAEFLERAVRRTDTLYGALNIEVTNVVFVHGSVDPWHMLGITKNKSQSATAIYIEGTAHCANMYPKSDDDLPQLTEAREQILQLIKTWLQQTINRN